MGQTDGTFTARERDVLRRALALVRLRVEREKRIEETLQAARASADAAFAAASDAAEREHRAAESEIEAASAAASRSARLEHEFESSRAKAERDAGLEASQEATGAEEREAAKEHQESIWLAQTMAETAGKKARAERESRAKEISEWSAQISALQSGVERALRRKGFEASLASPRSTRAGEAREAGGPARGREEGGREDGASHGVAGGWEERRSDAAASLDALRAAARVVERRASPGVVVFLWGLTALAAIGAVGVWGFAVRVESGRWVMWALGASPLALGAFTVLLRTVLRGRVEGAAAAFAEKGVSAGAAVHAGEAWSESRRDADNAAAAASKQREIGAARARFEQRMHGVLGRRSADEPRVRGACEAVLVASREKFGERSRDLERSRRHRLSEASGARDAKLREAEGVRQRVLDAARDAQVRDWDDLVRTWEEGTRAVYADYGVLRGRMEEVCESWDSPRWEREDVGVPGAWSEAVEGVRFGTMEVDLREVGGGVSSEEPLALPGPEVLRLPAVLDLEEKASLVIHSGGSARGREAALGLVRDVMLRLLTSLPAGKVRFTLVDPVGLGESFAGFMHLADDMPLAVGERVWTEPRQIEQQLTDLTQHMENVIQKYLRNEYASIGEYNRRAGEVAEAYRFLVVADFPANITEPAAKRLASVARSGPRCGVHVLAVTDLRGKRPEWLRVEELEESAVVLRWSEPKGAQRFGEVGTPHGPGDASTEGRFVRVDQDFSAFPLRVEACPEGERFTHVVRSVGRAIRDAGQVRVPFEMVAPGSREAWSGDSAEELRVPIGRAGATKLQHLTLGKGTAQHVLIAGRTGSGKSTLLHAIVTSAGLWYGPDQVEFYLVDFKKGVEFKTYAARSLAHARVIAVESEREFGLSVLKRLDEEITRRGEMFRRAGVQDLARFRRAEPAAVMPRSVLIVDEFQEFFVQDDKVAQEAALLLDRLVRQGRAFGVHVILGSQTLGGAYSLARATIGQMAVRVALQCSESDSYLILSEDNSAPRLLTRPGEAIYNDASGLVEGNSPFQIVWLPDEERDRKLDEVGRLASAMSPRVREACPAAIVFEGNIPADITTNDRISAAVARASRAAGEPEHAWLGDAVSIKEPASVVFRPQSAANVLVVGQQEQGASGIGASIIACLARRQEGGTRGTGDDSAKPGLGMPLSRVTVVNAESMDGPDGGAITRLAEELIDAGADLRAVTPRECDAAVAALHTELIRRRELDSGGGVGGEGTTGTGLGPSVASAYLILVGAQRLRPVRRGDDFDFSSGAELTTEKRFAELIREGPGHGIHVVLCCDTAANLDRILDRRALREFQQRVLFQMSATDSVMLIDSPAAAGLGRHRALLFREESGEAEKFRPYGVPPTGWAAGLLRKA